MVRHSPSGRGDHVRGKLVWDGKTVVGHKATADNPAGLFAGPRACGDEFERFIMPADPRR